MKNISVSMLVWLIIVTLHGFVPTQPMFSRTTLWETYRAWLSGGGFRSDNPAFLSKERISKEYRSASGDIAHLLFLRDQDKITEIIEEFPLQDDPLTDQTERLKIIPGGLLFRVNAGDISEATQYMRRTGIELKCGATSGEDALSALWRLSAGNRLRVDSVTMKQAMGKVTFRFDLRMGSFTVSFPGNEKVDLATPSRSPAKKPARKEYRHPEPKPVTSPQAEMIPQPEPIVSPVIAEPAPVTHTPPDTVAWQQAALSAPASLRQDISRRLMIRYIYDNLPKSQSRNMLHNRIADPGQFMTDALPRHIRVDDGDRRVFTLSPFMGLKGDIAVRSVTGRDGIDIRPAYRTRVEDNAIMLEDERIPCNNLSPEEMAVVAGGLGQLVYSYRVLGSELVNFSLVPDAADATLVLKGDQRDVFQVRSHIQLLLMLHGFWKEHRVLFSLREIRKVDGYVEMVGNLVAIYPKGDLYDFAEVRFHLNRDYMIDMMMMFLTPAVVN